MSSVDGVEPALPVGSSGTRSNGWWGMLAMISTEASLFAYLIFSYLYLASQTLEHWPPGAPPRVGIGLLNTGVLISSSVLVWLCEKRVRQRRVIAAVGWMAAGIVLGLVFVWIQLKEWHDRPYDMTTHQYGSLYFTITGFHVAHVLVGLVVLIALLLWTALGYFDEKRYAALKIGGLYWHFVDVVWIFIFITLYITPYLF